MLLVLDGSHVAGILGYVINSAIASYLKYADAIHHALTPDGQDLIAKTQNQCKGETIANFMFRHNPPYFTVDTAIARTREPFKSCSPSSASGATNPARIMSNRYDPLVPYDPRRNSRVTDAHAAPTWSTSPTKHPLPLFIKLIVNHAFPIVVDAHRALEWV